MRGAPILIALLAAGFAPLASAAAKPSHAAMFRGVPKTALLSAAKSAPLRLIDALETYCDGETPIGEWLRQLTVGKARRIDWTAGPCELVDTINPLDAGGSYCVQATISLAHPKDRHDTPEIEIYLQDPKRGKPGAVYAFRASFDGVDGPDYIRFRKDFEDEWRERFTDTQPPPCTN
jgi:hypothetical protein